MSTTLWLSLGRSTAVAVALLALSSATHAADIPENLCVSQKLSAASFACMTVFRAWVYPPPTEVDAAAVTKAGESLATNWSRAEQFARGGDCAQSAATSDAVQSDIASAAGNISGGIKAGVDLENPADVACRMKRVQTAGLSCAKFLRTDSDAAHGLPQVKLDKKRSKLADNVTRKLAALSCASGTAPDDIVSAILSLESAVVTDTLTPAPLR